MSKCIHHIGCLVNNLGKVMNSYTALFPGSDISEIYEIPIQKVRIQFIDAPNLKIELVQPMNPESSLFKMMEKQQGYYHIGIMTNEIGKETDKLTAEGYKVIGTFFSPAYQGKQCVFLFSPSLHLIELIEQ